MPRTKIPNDPTRIQPPNWIGARARRIFRELVASFPADHFHAGDVYQLATYCDAVADFRRALEAGDEKLKRTSRGIMVRLATSLRLSVAAREDPKRAGGTGRRKSQEPTPVDAEPDADDWERVTH